MSFHLRVKKKERHLRWKLEVTLMIGTKILIQPSIMSLSQNLIQKRLTEIIILSKLKPKLRYF